MASEERPDLSIHRDHERRITRTLAIARDYAGGVDVEEMQRRYGVSRTTIVRIGVLFGARRSKSWYSPEKKAEVVRRYVAGEKVADLCRAEGITMATLYVWLRAFEIERRKREYQTAKRFVARLAEEPAADGE